MIGERVSHYHILEKLGGGGMGVVYKARDLRLDRLVALKFLPPELTRDEEANQRFMHEARAASALDHPHICTIHEIDETPTGQVFITMAYYDGETLKKRIERGPSSADEALQVAIQIAQGLARAHESGIVHRDIKPANVMVTKDGLVKILDFGIAKLTGGTGLTQTGSTLGTVAYMAPEQARGAPVDQRADVWALGVVLYELLTGRRPFEGDSDLVVLNAIQHQSPVPPKQLRPDVPADLDRVVERALDKNGESRYRSGAEMLKDLTAAQAALAATAAGAPNLGAVLRLFRKPAIVIPGVLIVAAAGLLAAGALTRSGRTRWAREEALPEIARLVDRDDYAAAFALAKQAEAYIPNDPMLVGLWPRISATGSIVSSPDGADVYVRPYGANDDEWEHLGRTPLEGIRLARSVFQFRIEKEGFEPQLLAARNPSNLLHNAGPRSKPIVISLRKAGADRSMVPVPGGAYAVSLSGFNMEDLIDIGPFSIDRHEVTNRQFKEFVDRNGYENQEYWRDFEFVKDGRRVTWPEAVAEFRDASGRPGPATWELGDYPADQGDHPVSGVSWYEAAAYCRFRGKTLPSSFHWARAALSPVEIGTALGPSIVPLSNFSDKGLATVGQYQGLGPYGTYDMAGNVREWCWNEEVAGNRRWILGGAWSDPEYMFSIPNSSPPFDRSPLNGFRCAQYDGGEAVAASLLAPVATLARDHRTAKAVSDEVFDVFKRQFSYSRSPLNERIEARDETAADWVREKLTFDAGYGNERVIAYVFLPKQATPPYQSVIFFPGLGFFLGRASSDSLQLGDLDYVVKSGRVLIWPAYKGSFERWDPFLSLVGEDYLRSFRTRMQQWRQDLGRTIDVLAARSDIDVNRIAYMGRSFGASTALPLLALEDRLKAAVLISPGFSYRRLPPEADAINYVSRAKLPVLMIGGRHDYIFPLYSSREPLFERFGTAPEHKRHVILEAGHGPLPRGPIVREVLAWLDQYLGPVARHLPTR